MKHSLVSTFFLVALTVRIAWADIGPGWYMQPLMIPTNSQKVSTVPYPTAPSASPKLLVKHTYYPGPFTYQSQSTQPTEISEERTDEIQSLARNLENDRKRIFDYVHNYIRYVHYFGSKKGAYLTFLEGSGNDFDQCALLVALLRAAAANDPTVNKYTLHYQFGMMRIPYEASDNLDLKHWLGLKFSGNGDEDLLLIDNVYAGGGFPLYQPSPGPNPDPNLNRFVLVPWENGHLGQPGHADKTSFYVHRVWVRLHDNTSAKDYYLDPAFKTGNLIDGLKPSDLSTAMGLNTTDLFAGATTGIDTNGIIDGGIRPVEVTPNYVRHVNYSQISGRLVGYTGNLLGQFSTTYKNFSTDQVISGYRIQESDTLSDIDFRGLAFAPQENTFNVDNFGSANPDSKTVPILEWDNIPDTYMSTLHLQIDWNAALGKYDVDKTYKFAELKGQKLTLTFTSKKATISIDDVVDTIGTTTAGTTASMITWVTNVFGAWDYTAKSVVVLDKRSWQKDGDYGTVTYQRNAPGYVIAYNFDDPGQLLTRRRQKLDALIRQGLGPRTPKVITETLNVLGLSWFQQTYLAQRIIAGQRDMLVTTLHRVGRVAQEYPASGLGYFIDIKMQNLSAFPRLLPIASAVPSFNAFIDMWAFALSAMEHGVIEQLQPIDAASTIKTIYQANEKGDRLILLTPNNVMDPKVSDYFGYGTAYGAAPLSSQELGQLINLVQPGVSLFLPAGRRPIGRWNGSAYVKRTVSGSYEIINMIIKTADNAYSGGFSATPTWLDPYPVYDIFLNLPTLFDLGTPLLSHNFGADPVNMLDGSFTVDSVDLSVGQAEPRGFSFSRHYDTNRRSYNDANLGYGWTHNYAMKAAELSDPAAALGKTTPQAMAAFLVAMNAASAVFTASDTGTILNGPPPGDPPPPVTAPLRWAVAALITHWGIDQLKNNAVTITLGKDAVEFIKQPNGGFTPPAGSKMYLTKPGPTLVGPNVWTIIGYQLQMHHGNMFTFDAKSNQVTNIIDQYSKEMKLTYLSGRLNTVVDCWGRTLRLVYDSANRLASVSDGSRIVKFGYTQKNLTSVTDPESKKWTYQYDTSVITNAIIATKDPLLRVITTNIYDSFGAVTQQWSQGIAANAWNIYVAGNRVSVQKDPRGGKTTYYYDEKQRLVATKDANLNKTSYAYDGQDHVVTNITPKNEITVFEYDGRHNLTQITDPLNKIAIFKHDVNDTLTNYTDFHDIGTIGHGITNKYNGKFLITKITKPKINDTSDNIVDFAYNETGVTAGTLASRTEHEGNVNYVTSFEYDSHGELSKVTYPNSTDYESYFVNSLGDVTNHTDAKGIVTRFEYNKRRQLTQTTVDPTGLNIVTRITYDDAGNPQRATDGRGFDTISTYSATQKLLTNQFPQLADLSVPMAVNHYDERDWLDFSENPLLDNGKTMYGYDDAGHLKTVTDPLIRVTTYGYDEDGHKISVKSPLAEENQTTQFGYNARGEQTSLTDAATLSIAYGYDPNGNPTTIQNRNANTFVSTYYGNNQLHTFQTPLQRTTTFKYVPRGMVDSIWKPSNPNPVNPASTIFEYDDRGRLWKKSDAINQPNTKTIYGYDKNNNLLSVSENGKTIGRTYDPANRLYSYTDQNNNTIGYRYDKNGNLTKLIYPDLREVNYEYDSNNRLTNVTDWASRVTKLTYDIAGRPATITRPNGTVRQVTYDDANQLTAIDERKSDASLIYRFVATTYDRAGRLTAEAVSPPGSFSTPTISAEYNGDNQISKYQGTTLNNNYDADGNMTSGPLNSDTLVTYGYDARNQLTFVGGVTYTYDSEGYRLTMTVSGQQPTTFTNDASGNVLIRTRPDGTKTYYVYGAGLLYDVEMYANGTETGTRHTYHYDMRGSTVALTDTSSQVTDRISYGPYGNSGTRTGNSDTPFLFNGRYGVMTDPNSLLYMQARYYNPYICSFINADPSGFAGGMNFYAFANGNPVSLLDPFGLGAVGASSFSSSFNTSYLDDLAYNASPAGQFMAGYHQTQAQMQQFTSFQPTPPSGRAALSSALNAIPYVGGFKMSGEAFFGNDFVTGQRIEDLVAHAGAGVENLGLSILGTMAARSSTMAAEDGAFIRCFPSGTMVLMADGTAKPIETIETGEEVLAKDPARHNESKAMPVVSLIKSYTEHLVTISVNDSRGSTASFQATREHPFWVKNKGWVYAKDLRITDLLVDTCDGDVNVIATDVRDARCSTYNLTIDRDHTFYIVDSGISVLVHNATPFQVGTFGSLNAAIDVGDGLAAHEPLVDAYLRAIGFNTTGRRLGSNPAIALPAEIHAEIGRQQIAWGIRDPAFLRTQTPKQVVDANYRFMINARVAQGPAQQVSQDAFNFIRQNKIRCP